MELSSLSSELSTILSTAATTQTSGKALTLTLGQRSKDASTLQVATTKAPTDTSETFAAEIMRRLESANSATSSNASGLVSSGAAGNLESALADTIDYVRKQHGDAAATAVMGIIISGVGNGSGGEDALGNALVSSLKFIDRNFGIAAGDAAMAQYNGALNDAVNNYFQNGRNEKFYASDGSSDLSGQVRDILSSTLSGVTERFGADAAKTVSDIVTGSLKQTGISREGLGTAVSAADQYLSDNYGVSDLLGSQVGTQTSLAKGTVLDLAV